MAMPPPDLGRRQRLHGAALLKKMENKKKIPAPHSIMQGFPARTAILGREHRLILAAAVAIVVSAGVFLGFDAYRRHEQVLIQARQDNDIVARAAAEYTRATFEAIGLRLDDAVREHSAWNATPHHTAESGYRILAEIVRGTRHLTGIGWMNEEGYLVASSVGPNRRPINVADEPHFIAQAEGRGSGLFVGPPTVSRQDGKQILTFSRRLETSSGKFQGIVTGFSDLQELRAGLARMRLDETIAVRVLLPNEVPLMEVTAPGKGPFTVTRQTIDGAVPLLIEAVSDDDAVLESWRQYSNRSLVVWLLFAALTSFGTAGLMRLLAQRREQDERLRLVIQGTNEGIWDWNLSTREQYYSPRWKEILGYRDEEIANVESSLRELLHPDDLAVVGEALERHLNQRAPFQVECRMRHKDNSWRWIMARGEAVRDAAGQAVRMVGAISDISERKQGEKSLRDSETRFREIAEAAGGYIWEMDLDHRYTMISERSEILFGYQPTEMVGRRPCDFMPPGELERVNAWIAANRLNDGAVRFLEHRSIGKSGKIFWQQVHMIPVQDASGQLVGHRGTGVDITERKLTEKALSDNATWLSSMFNGSPIGIAVVRVSDEVIVDANEAALRIIERRREDVIGRTPTQLQLFVDQSQHQEAMRRLLEQHVTEQVQFDFRKSTGESGVLEYYARLIQIQDVQYVVGMWLDISERRKAESARAELAALLRESQKMEALGTMAGGIAHDFNNILATILGNVELARQDSVNNPPALDSLEEIHKAGARARDLVQQILSFSRRQPTERKLIDMAPVVQEAARLLRRTLPARLALEVHCASDVPKVLADATQVEQMVINLATNALQAMPEGPGRIDLRLDAVMLDLALAERHPELGSLYKEHPGMTVRLMVTDTGTGMDAGTMARIFEPFFTTKPVGEGTGLGLAVVYGMVQGHEGMVTVQSEPGQGSIFMVYLPAADVEGDGELHASRSAGGSPVVRGGGHRILYVDDDGALAYLVKRLLERRGFRVNACTDQEEALAALRADPQDFDLVLTDYNMPGMSGLDVAREVRQIRADLPVAVASGFVDEVLRSQADEAGVRQLLFKADDVEVFCAAIQRLVDDAGQSSRAT